jgi:putative DNA primase/helicase
MLYLTHRGITIPVPPSLRWVPSLRRPDDTHSPATIARVDAFDGELIGLHRTFLEHDTIGIWRRRDRASLRPITDGAVRLAPADERLMVGVETCLAGMQTTKQPAWAALSTLGMVALASPPIVRMVIILADNDRNGAGERATHARAQRWLREGRRVRIALPPEPGTHMVDVLAGHTFAEPRDAAA